MTQAQSRMTRLEPAGFAVLIRSGTRILPGAADVIDAKLVGVAWPWGSSIEAARGGNAGRVRTASELVMNRMHQVLAHAP